MDIFYKKYIEKIIIIFKKEFRSYFNSLIAYIVLVVFLLITGYFFAVPLFIINQATLRHLVNLLPLMFLFFIPAITMRLFSEEIKVGTIEILLTQPVNDYEILIGKYIAGVVFISVGILATFFYPITLIFIGKLDIGQTIAQYIGLFFLIIMFSSIGIFGSILTKNQIVAFIISFVICFAFFIIGKLNMLVPPVFVKLVDFIGIDSHFENITRGVIDTRDIIYFLSIAGLFLISTLAIFRSRK